MGTKYTTTAVSGYNASPPADDGSQVASNQVLWATIKTKLPDPIKTALESINSKLVTALDTSVTLTSVSYNTVAGDHAKTVQIASTTSPAVTISLGDAATMAAGYYVTITNQSAYTCTVGRVTGGDTINGTAANVSLPSKWSATFKVNSAANGYNVESISDNTFSTSSIIVNEGRLTLATGTPVTTTDQTAKTTVYWTPYVGKNIALYSGSSWVTFSQAELSVSVPANTSTPFDVFMDYNSGTPALVATAWTNDTTRATALTTQDGVLVKSGTTTQRYLGTGRTTTVSGQTEDSDANRLLWNYYNRVSRRNRATFSADRSTSSATYVELNSEIQCKFIIGVEEEIAILTAAGTSYNAGTNRNRTAFGIDSTSSATAPVMQYMAAEYMSNAIVHSQTFTAGYHYVTLLGNTTASTGTWTGTTVDSGRWYLNVVMMR